MIKQKLFFFVFFTFFIPFISTAQTNELPSWVSMIDNESVNYYEAIEIFNDYWKGKIKPIEEMDLNEMEEMTIIEKNERINYFNSLSIEEKNYYDLLQYHYKRFKQWRKETLPFVQEDGRILNMKERIAIWEKQQVEIKNLKK